MFFIKHLCPWQKNFKAGTGEKVAAICNHWPLWSRYCINTMFCFPCLTFTDYLNNLSPDSKEYEDTQGTAEAARHNHSLSLARPAETHCLHLLTRRHSVACKSPVLFFSPSVSTPLVSVCVLAALVIVSEVADQANDNLKHGVSLRWIGSTCLALSDLWARRIEKQAGNGNSSFWGRQKEEICIHWLTKKFPCSGILHLFQVSTFRSPSSHISSACVRPRDGFYTYT